MAAIASTHAQATGLRHAIARMIDAVRTWNDVRATRAALSQLTDRELEDIGLCRGDIKHVSRII